MCPKLERTEYENAASQRSFFTALFLKVPMANEVDPYFGSDEFIIRCSSVESAKEYINEVFENASRSQKESIVKNVLSIDQRQINSVRRRLRKKRKKQNGGGTFDPRILDLIGMADIIHDFDDTRYVRERAVFPNEIDMVMLDKESCFVRKMAQVSFLTFGNEKVPNPAFGAVFLDRYDLKTDSYKTLNNTPWTRLGGICARQATETKLQLKNRREIVCADIMAPLSSGKRDKRVLKMEQVAMVIRVMNEKFGFSADFVVDNEGNPLHTLVISVMNLRQGFFEMYATQPKYSESKDLSEALLVILQQTQLPNWKIVTVDATVFDTAPNSRMFELCPDDKTGTILGLSPGISLQGLDVKYRANGMVQVAHVRIELFGRTLLMRGPECTQKFSKRNISRLIDLDDRSPINDERDEYLRSLGKDTLYALKRAGDWGQVEHCVKFDRVFFTSDKLAALYAHARGCRYVYMRFENLAENPLDALPSLCRFSFAVR